MNVAVNNHSMFPVCQNFNSAEDILYFTIYVILLEIRFVIL